MIVLAILGILAAIMIPNFQMQKKKAAEKLAKEAKYQQIAKVEKAEKTETDMQKVYKINGHTFFHDPDCKCGGRDL